jgi:hypothetical protein
MRGGRSAARRTFRSIGSMSTAGSHSSSPMREASKRSCSASPKLAARGRRFPNPWASAPRQACERSTRPSAHGGARLRRASQTLVRPFALGAQDLPDSWAGMGVSRSHGPPGLRPPTHAIRRAKLARDFLHDRDGALADERRAPGGSGRRGTRRSGRRGKCWPAQAANNSHLLDSASHPPPPRCPCGGSGSRSHSPCTPRWREEPRVWRAVPSSRVRGDDKNQNVVVRGATDRLRRKFKS